MDLSCACEVVSSARLIATAIAARALWARSTRTRRVRAAESPMLDGQCSMPNFTLIPLANRRDQILVECAAEVEARGETPVAPRARIVHIRGPRVDNRLTFLVDLPRDPRLGKGVHDDVANLPRRWIERGDVVRAA